MTTTVVVRKGRKAVIGADTLGTYGDQRESAEYIKNASKLIRIDDTWLAVSGHAALDMVMRNLFKNSKSRRSFNGVDEILSTALAVHAALKDRYFLNPEDEDSDSFESSHMNVLIANSHGIFGLCARRTVFEYTKFYAFGSGEQYALGAMRAVYDRLDDAEEIARVGLDAAIAFDTGTGGPVEIETITLKKSDAKSA